MLFTDFLKWWYGAGWVLRLNMLKDHVLGSIEFFSIGILLQTLFSPWRQNVTEARSDQSLNVKFNALLDNIVSRVVGFTVRVVVLIASVITVTVVFVSDVLIATLWPLLPLVPAIIIGIGASL